MIPNHFIPHELWILMNRREGQQEAVMCIRWSLKETIVLKGKDVSSHQSITSRSHQTLRARGHNWRRVDTVSVCAIITVALCVYMDIRFNPYLTRAGMAGGGPFLGSCSAIYLPSANACWILSCPWALLQICHVVFLSLLIKTMQPSLT